MSQSVPVADSLVVPAFGQERPELLSPAGDWDALRAAVANGADAVYFGLSDFNARHRATNFTLEELPQVLEYLHDHNVRGYVTCNTLIFSDELPQLVDYAAALARAGADAVIVQDLGLARLLQRLAPELHVHASTQMTLTEPRGIELIRSLGIRRAILARELSLKDIHAITQATTLPVEVFVHGALCVAYSGQCLTSESLGGRSANRGQCAQACRLPYDLMVDGAERPLGDLAYLLSPQDLAAPELIDALVREGVSCFKIEGRLKSAQYVAATTQTYRAALDAALEQQAFHLTREQAVDLAQSFSRGFTHGFLDGVNHQRLVQGRFPKSRGVAVGRVTGLTRTGVLVELTADFQSLFRDHPGDPPLRAGDGVVFDEGHPEQDEQGGRLYDVALPSAGGRSPRVIELVFHPGNVTLSAINPGARVWKTDDPRFRKRMEQSYNRDVVQHRQPLDFRIDVAVDTPITITARDSAGHAATVVSEQSLAVARNRPLTLEWLRSQLDRLGDTPFSLGDVELCHAGQPVSAEDSVPVMLPASLLNELRRQVVQQIREQRQIPNSARGLNPQALDEFRVEITQRHPVSLSDSPATPQLHILVRTMDQLRSVLDWRKSTDETSVSVASIACDFEDPRRYQGAVDFCREAGVPIRLATLRILKPGEEGWLRQIAQMQPEVILVRSLAALQYYRERFPQQTLWGDYSLNVANELTADWLIGQGLQRLVPSYDLNWRQMVSLLGRFDPQRFEVVIHQHMPMFHMEHCVFCHTLSTGTDYRDCGRPCEQHQVELRDRVGEAHPLLADVGCRNTVFNAHAQSAAEYVPRMRELGLQHFRIELVRESGAELADLLTRYSRLLAGQELGRTTWDSLRVLPQLGVTRGPLDFE